MNGTAHESEAIVGLSKDALRSLIGHRISRFSCRSSSAIVQEERWATATRVHEIDQALVISTHVSAVVLEWNIRNYDEFLNVTDSNSSAATAAVGDDLDLTNVYIFFVLFC
jgi:hypothetical protein